MWATNNWMSLFSFSPNFRKGAKKLSFAYFRVAFLLQILLIVDPIDKSLGKEGRAVRGILVKKKSIRCENNREFNLLLRSQKSGYK